MIKKTLSQFLRCSLVVCLSATLSLTTISMTGCGPSDPDESTMDRVPKVPPSGRGEGTTPKPPGKGN